MRFHLCCFGLIAMVGAVASAQTDIPIKTGLWESSYTSSMAGIHLPPDTQARIAQMPPEQQERIRKMMGGSPNTSVVRSCVTKEDFEKWNDSLAQQKDKNAECSNTTVSQTSQSRIVDVNCTSSSGKTTGRVEMYFDSDVKGHGTVHMVRAESEGRQAGKPITIDMKFDSHFVSSDCGDIKPGEGRTVH